MTTNDQLRNNTIGYINDFYILIYYVKSPESTQHKNKLYGKTNFVV